MSYANRSLDGELSAELDPLGTHAGLSSPYNLPHPRRGAEMNSVYPSMGDPTASGSTQCIANGIEISCEMAMNMLDHGLAKVAPPGGPAQTLLNTRTGAFHTGILNMDGSGTYRVWVEDRGTQAHSAVDADGYDSHGNVPVDWNIDALGHWENHSPGYLSDGSLFSSGPQQHRQKPLCPPVPEAPREANLDANIRLMQKNYRHAQEISPYPDAGDDPAARVLGHISNFVGLVIKGGPWDYKQLTPPGTQQYTPFGNFHFGAVGRAAGFDTPTILRAAGFIQKWFGDVKGDGGRVGLINVLSGQGGQEPFEDQLDDQENIKKGIEYYERKFVRQDCQ
jgi:hypothetical protein